VRNNRHELSNRPPLFRFGKYGKPFNMEREFREHELSWNREYSARFWNYQAHSGADYFSQEVGPGIVRATVKAGVPLRGRILDFGCGPGHFLEILTAQKIACEGADFSSDSIRETNTRLNGSPYFRGVTQISGIPTQLADEQFDVIFCIETIEHILPEELPPTFQELHRLAKPGGFLVVTTPNDEQLDRGKAMCPQCGAIFHRMQHVNSWNVRSISEFNRSIGFQTVQCLETYLNKSSLRSMAARLVKRLCNEKMPHLVYIGKKI
jgi:2-polyprenyl-3-methyl-5-hydroxy-6-metoxy-1,4-benzoquinol methylase